MSNKNSYYFPHDYNSIQDPKMMTLLGSCGLGGIGIYWIIIEILHQQPDGKITIEAYENYIQFYAGFENKREDYVSKIKQMLSKTNLLLNDGKYIWSERVLNNFKKREEISQNRAKAGRIGGLNKSSNMANAKQNVANAKQNVANKIKGNKNKINNISNNNHLPTQKDFEKIDIQSICDDYKVPQSFVLSKWDDIINYCHSRNKRYSDFNRVLRTWVKKDAINIIKEEHGKSIIGFATTD